MWPTRTAELPLTTWLHYNLGANRATCGQTEAALQAFEQTLRIDPRHLQAHQNLALIHLRQGDLQTGWAHYAWRFNRYQMEGAPAQWTTYTRTLPLNLTGVTVALLGEQGIGDEMFFLRYLPLLNQWQAQGLIVYVLPETLPPGGAASTAGC